MTAPGGAPRRARAYAIARRMLRWTAKAAVACAGLSALFALMAPHLPLESLVDRARLARPPDTVIVVDRRGAELRHARVEGIDRRWIGLGEVSPHLVAAVLAAEDARFNSHRGVDWRSVGRAAVTNLVPWRRRSGASTITQQVVKLTHGRPAGLLSKAIEIVRACGLERMLSKDEILEQYLNRLPFGDRIEGVARASEEYFGHPASQLSVAEAALIAGIPQAPSATEPRRHLERAIRRRNQVLERMAAAGWIDAATLQAALQETPRIRLGAVHPDEASRYVDAALAHWKAGRMDRDGSYLRTSLDLSLQHRSEELLDAAVTRYSGRGVTNAAAIVVANGTGEILAYVGAANDGPSSEGGALDLLARRRQPGSTLKPFAYELLFEQGATAATLLDDVAVPRTGAQGRAYEPRDYDGKERGPVRARVALSASLNLAALDAAGRVGQDELVRRLSQLGFARARDPEQLGAAAVLGGVDVTAVELAHAYVALARGGTAIPLSAGQTSAQAGSRVMSPEAAAVTADILSDTRARIDGFGSDLVELAGTARFGLKTGTSAGWRDCWAAAFTPTFTIVVWLGDPAGHPLGGVSGFEAAAPLAARLLAAAQARAAINGAADFKPPPARLLSVEICPLTGLRPGPHCRGVVTERFAPGTVPSQSCSNHDSRGRDLLPRKYAAWAERSHPSGLAPDFLAESSSSSLEVVEPRDGARLLIDPSRGANRIAVRATHSGASWEVDGSLLDGDRWEPAPGRHSVVAILRGARSLPARVEVSVPDRE
jgi:penicillin-binding protein 1C